MPAPEYLLGIDYGEKRVGIALAHTIARLPKPYSTLINDGSVVAQIASLVEREKVGLVVVGLPMSMDGSASRQTQIVEAFAHDLKLALGIPVFMVDETLTSVAAEEILGSQKQYKKPDVDALAAALILERYIEDTASAEPIT